MSSLRVTGTEISGLFSCEEIGGDGALVPSEGWEQIITQKITIDAERCLGCGDCAVVCPFMVYEIKKAERGKKTKKIAVPVYQEDCFLCQSCQAQCPTDAITIEW